MDERKNLINEISKYDGVVFDLDETLIDLRVDWVGLKHSLHDYCFDNYGEEIIFTPLDERLLEARKLLGENIYKELLGIVADFELEFKNEYLPNKILLDYINSNNTQKIGIYSMNTQKTLGYVIAKYFSLRPNLIISKDNCIEPKPTEKDLEKIVTAWNIPKEKIVYVGNSKHDALSGELAGIRTIIIDLKNYL